MSETLLEWAPQPHRECMAGDVPFLPHEVCAATGLAWGEVRDGTRRMVTLPIVELTPGPAERERLRRLIRSDDDPQLFLIARSDVRRRLLDWLRSRFERTASGQRSSFSLWLEWEARGVMAVSHGELKGALLAAGFQPSCPFERNWTCRIKRR